MKSVNLKIGSKVSYQKQNYEIIRLIDLNTILAAHTISGEHKRIKIGQIQSADASSTTHSSLDLVSVPDVRWAEAQRRLDIIRPFLTHEVTRTKENVDKRANKCDTSTASIYRWLRSYTEWPELISLLPKEKTGGRGQSRLSEKLENALDYIIQTYYLDKQKRSVTRTYRELQLYCQDNGLEAPHINTLRNRISAISNKNTAKARLGRKATEKYLPVRAEFPGGSRPLEVVQIDHTPLDLIIVDEENRQPIGRPYLTVAIDVFSRTVTGFVLTLEPPSSMTVGLCLAHSILSKEKWLNTLEVSADWPIWGLMRTVHVDNASEFRSKYLDRACDNYGISIEYRPVARPNFGGHIERLLGTFLKEVHNIEGTTFSNVQDRGEYDSEKHSSMTMKEAEKWLTVFITKIYHNRIHSALQTTPLAMYENGIMGNQLIPPSGLPRKITDERRLRIDMLPVVERTVQRYGISIDHIYYYHDCLRHWILEEDSSSAVRKRKFIVRRDPRDISSVYFFDPTAEEYFEIPYRDITYPVMTVWELKAIQKKLKDDGIKNLDENAIFSAYRELKEIESEASSVTKKSRRKQQRAKEAKRSKSEHFPTKSISKSQVNDDDIFGDIEAIQPFEEID